MSFPWICPGELLPRVTHNLLRPFKVRWAAKEQGVQSPPIAITTLLTGLLPPITIQYPRRQRQSRVETNLQTVVGVPTRCHSVLPSHKQPRHTNAAGKSSATSPKICKHIER